MPTNIFPTNTFEKQTNGTIFYKEGKLQDFPQAGAGVFSSWRYNFDAGKQIFRAENTGKIYEKRIIKDLNGNPKWTGWMEVPEAEAHGIQAIAINDRPLQLPNTDGAIKLQITPGSINAYSKEEVLNIVDNKITTHQNGAYIYVKWCIDPDTDKLAETSKRVLEITYPDGGIENHYYLVEPHPGTSGVQEAAHYFIFTDITVMLPGAKPTEGWLEVDVPNMRAFVSYPVFNEHIEDSHFHLSGQEEREYWNHAAETISGVAEYATDISGMMEAHIENINHNDAPHILAEERLYWNKAAALNHKFPTDAGRYVVTNGGYEPSFEQIGLGEIKTDFLVKVAGQTAIPTLTILKDATSLFLDEPLNTKIDELLATNNLITGFKIEIDRVNAFNNTIQFTLDSDNAPVSQFYSTGDRVIWAFSWDSAYCPFTKVIGKATDTDKPVVLTGVRAYVTYQAKEDIDIGDQSKILPLNFIGPEDSVPTYNGKRIDELDPSAPHTATWGKINGDVVQQGDLTSFIADQLGKKVSHAPFNAAEVDSSKPGYINSHLRWDVYRNTVIPSLIQNTDGFEHVDVKVLGNTPGISDNHGNVGSPNTTPVPTGTVIISGIKDAILDYTAKGFVPVTTKLYIKKVSLNNANPQPIYFITDNPAIGNSPMTGSTEFAWDWPGDNTFLEFDTISIVGSAEYLTEVHLDVTCVKYGNAVLENKNHNLTVNAQNLFVNSSGNITTKADSGLLDELFKEVNTEILSGLVLKIGKDRNTTIGENEFISVKGALNKTVGLDETLRTQGNKKETVEGNDTKVIDGNKVSTISGFHTEAIKGYNEETVGGYETRNIEGDNTITISGEQSVAIKGQRTTSVSGDDTYSTLGNKKDTVSGNASYSTEGDVDISVSGKVITTVEGPVVNDFANDVTDSIVGNKNVTINGAVNEVISGEVLFETKSGQTEVIGKDAYTLIKGNDEIYIKGNVLEDISGSLAQRVNGNTTLVTTLLTVSGKANFATSELNLSTYEKHYNDNSDKDVLTTDKNGIKPGEPGYIETHDVYRGAKVNIYGQEADLRYANRTIYERNRKEDLGQISGEFSRLDSVISGVRYDLTVSGLAEKDLRISGDAFLQGQINAISGNDDNYYTKNQANERYYTKEDVYTKDEISGSVDGLFYNREYTDENFYRKNTLNADMADIMKGLGERYDLIIDSDDELEAAIDSGEFAKAKRILFTPGDYTYAGTTQFDFSGIKYIKGSEPVTVNAPGNVIRDLGLGTTIFETIFFSLGPFGHEVIIDSTGNAVKEIAVSGTQTIVLDKYNKIYQLNLEADATVTFENVITGRDYTFYVEQPESTYVLKITNFIRNNAGGATGIDLNEGLSENISPKTRTVIHVTGLDVDADDQDSFIVNEVIPNVAGRDKSGLYHLEIGGISGIIHGSNRSAIAVKDYPNPQTASVGGSFVIESKFNDIAWDHNPRGYDFIIWNPKTEMEYWSGNIGEKYIFTIDAPLKDYDTDDAENRLVLDFAPVPKLISVLMDKDNEITRVVNGSTKVGFTDSPNYAGKSPNPKYQPLYNDVRIEFDMWKVSDHHFANQDEGYFLKEAIDNDGNTYQQSMPWEFVIGDPRTTITEAVETTRELIITPIYYLAINAAPATGLGIDWKITSAPLSSGQRELILNEENTIEFYTTPANSDDPITIINYENNNGTGQQLINVIEQNGRKKKITFTDAAVAGDKVRFVARAASGVETTIEIGVVTNVSPMKIIGPYRTVDGTLYEDNTGGNEPDRIENVHKGAQLETYTFEIEWADVPPTHTEGVWTSSNATILSVNSGSDHDEVTITAIKHGTISLTYVPDFDKTKKAERIIHVYEHPETIVITPVAELETGTVFTPAISWIPEGTDYKAVKWEVLPGFENYAAVLDEDNGVLKALDPLPGYEIPDGDHNREIGFKVSSVAFKFDHATQTESDEHAETALTVSTIRAQYLLEFISQSPYFTGLEGYSPKNWIEADIIVNGAFTFVNGKKVDPVTTAAINSLPRDPKSTYPNNVWWDQDGIARFNFRMPYVNVKIDIKAI
jgi:hypothetical protein